MLSLPPEWMNWTLGTILFLSFVILLIVTLTLWDIKDPGWARKGGLLPIATTRGDRVFMGLLLTGCIFCLWLLLIGQTAVWAVPALGVVALVTTINFF
jgi:predicted small integral membrane protein